MTLLELSEYDGRRGRPMYFSADGIVYDASSSEAFASTYSQWAGGDATVSLARMSLSTSDVNRTDWDCLDSEDRKSLDSWSRYFREKYPIRGRLKEYEDFIRQRSKER